MPNFKIYYENFTLDNPTVSFTVIIWAICIGLAAGTVFYTFAKYASARLIKVLCEKECFSKESASSLEALGIRPSLLLKRALRDGQPLRRYVVIANPEDCTVKKDKKGFLNGVYRFFRGEDIPEKIDLSRAVIYLDEEQKHTAQIRYVQKGSPILSVIIACIVFALLGVGLSFSLPKLFELLDSMLTAYKNL